MQAARVAVVGDGLENYRDEGREAFRRNFTDHAQQVKGCE